MSSKTNSCGYGFGKRDADNVKDSELRNYGDLERMDCYIFAKQCI